MKKYLFTGLLVLLPIVVSLLILYWFISFGTNPFVVLFYPLLCKIPLLKEGFWFFSHEDMMYFFSCVFSIGLFFVFFSIIGFLSTKAYKHLFEKQLDTLFQKIPIMNYIYQASKQITHLLLKTTCTTLPSVLVSYPSKEYKTFGIHTQTVFFQSRTGSKIQLETVYIPSSPAFTEGHLIHILESELTPSTMQLETGIQYIMTFGQSSSLFHGN